MEKKEYRDRDLCFDFYPKLSSEEEGWKWAGYLEKRLSLIDPTIVTGTRRRGTIFGTAEVYTVEYFGKISHRKVWPWETIPGLSDLKTTIESIVGETFTVCVIQYYRSGKIGINPHRDKEMKPGTKIAGLTFGQSRTLVLTSRYGDRRVVIPVTNCSLYVMNPPTNDWWTHSILKDDSKQARVSLTFRNY